MLLESLEVGGKGRRVIEVGREEVWGKGSLSMVYHEKWEKRKEEFFEVGKEEVWGNGSLLMVYHKKWEERKEEFFEVGREEVRGSIVSLYGSEVNKERDTQIIHSKKTGWQIGTGWPVFWLGRLAGQAGQASQVVVGLQVQIDTIQERVQLLMNLNPLETQKNNNSKNSN